MSARDDYLDRTPAQPVVDAAGDDAIVEALLHDGGGEVPPDLATVATAVRALRRATNRPVPPSAALAAQLATGEFAGTPERYRAPAPRPQGRGIGAAARRGVHALVHSLAAAPRMASGRSRSGHARLVTLAVGLVLIAVGAAGFARALPEPVQDGFETVVETVSRYEFPAAPGSELVPGPRTDQVPGPVGEADRSEISPPRDSSGGATVPPDPEASTDPDQTGAGTAGADSGSVPTATPGQTPTPAPAAGQPADPPPGQDRDGQPGNRPTEVPGQGDERRPAVPPGQQRKAE